jgi:putative protease
MIDHLPKMIGAGISSLKIEGRMKGIHYLATAVQVYRAAIDAYYRNPESYAVSDDWRKALSGITQRGYCTGFYLNDPEAALPNYETDKGDLLPRFVGKIIKVVNLRQFEVAVRNKITSADTLEFLPVSGQARSLRIARLMTPDHEAIAVAQSDARVIIETESPADLQPNDILYKLTAAPESLIDGCPHETP